MSKMLLSLHGGKVPSSFEELEALPGVGHKTASVVMSQAFGHSAFPVDTHIHRWANDGAGGNGACIMHCCFRGLGFRETPQTPKP